ncbi:hypothetical protein ARMGADRAFT_589088 [Armillaria gallica]|uniref:Uncharacterized protein n=1 Tax=Armillaria gallica TaxID=47427 RepID=A0A2H3DU86_ARMGA|nr:hypothetical protein ARMGADRAFT_589088 [Armillaria gallica]
MAFPVHVVVYSYQNLTLIRPIAIIAASEPTTQDMLKTSDRGILERWIQDGQLSRVPELQLAGPGLMHLYGAGPLVVDKAFCRGQKKARCGVSNVIPSNKSLSRVEEIALRLIKTPYSQLGLYLFGHLSWTADEPQTKYYVHWSVICLRVDGQNLPEMGSNERCA